MAHSVVGFISAGLEVLAVAAILLVTGVWIIWWSWRGHRTRGAKTFFSAGACLLVIVALVLARAATKLPTEMVLQKCRADLRGIGAALTTYSDMYGGYPPTLGALAEQRLVHPTTLHNPFCSNGQSGTSGYVYVQGLMPDDPGIWPVVFESSKFRKDGTRIVLFLSGDVSTLSGPDCDAMLLTFTTEFERRRDRLPAFVSK